MNTNLFHSLTATIRQTITALTAPTIQIRRKLEMRTNLFCSIVSRIAPSGSSSRKNPARRVSRLIQGFGTLALLSMTLWGPPAHAEGTLQVVGENANGLPYLIAFQYSNSVWREGFTSPLPTPIAQYYYSFGLYPAPYHNLLDIGTDGYGNPYVITYPNGSNWYAGYRLPAPVGVTFAQLSASEAEGNTEQVVGLNINGVPYLASWQYYGIWHAGFALPAPVGITYSEIRAQQAEGNTLQVIGLASNGSAYLVSWQDASGTWHPGFQLPAPTGITYSALAVSQSEGNTLQVVGLSNGNPYLISWQDWDGTWHSGFALSNPYGTSFISITTGHGTDGNLQVVGLDRYDRPYLIAWQAASPPAIAGQWGTYGLLPSPLTTCFDLVTGNSQ